MCRMDNCLVQPYTVAPVPSLTLFLVFRSLTFAPGSSFSENIWSSGSKFNSLLKATTIGVATKAKRLASNLAKDINETVQTNLSYYTPEKVNRWSLAIVFICDFLYYNFAPRLYKALRQLLLKALCRPIHVYFGEIWGYWLRCGVFKFKITVSVCGTYSWAYKIQYRSSSKTNTNQIIFSGRIEYWAPILFIRIDY